MATRKQILNKLVEIIEDTDIFNEVYKGVIPAIGVIKNYPAIAIAIDSEKRELNELASSCKYRNQLRIIMMIYNEGNSRTFEDLTSDLVEQVEDIISQSDELNSMVIDIYVSQIRNDGGILHPKALAEMELLVSYIR